MDASALTRGFVCAFFAACFLQSGLDKVFDWKGNLSWLVEHFAKTFLRTQVPVMLGIVTGLELLGGLSCAVSVAMVLFRVNSLLPMLAMSIVCLNLFLLFAGQRIAKDYAGAATLAIYFGVALLGLWLMPGMIGG